MKIFTLLFYSALRNSRKTVINMYESNLDDNSCVMKSEMKESANSTNVFEEFMNNTCTLSHSGLDMRNITNNNEHEELINISANFEKNSLLNKLNSPKLSIIAKMNLIDVNDHLFEDISYAPDICKGGLFDDFNFEF
tara:strand:- start:2150 stop:2560 length:411 start_codon:yes stop_codon:yes gene_type:complete